MKLKPEALAKYQELYQKDPLSKVFAPLAESYREMGLIQEGLEVALKGVANHPNYSSGWIVLGRLQISAEQPKEALQSLNTALELDPSNLLALELLAQAHLLLEDPNQALSAFKRLLFYNPQSAKAKNAILKLESIVDETEEEFSNHKLQAHGSEPQSPAPLLSQSYLQRQLTLFDALLIKGDFASCEILSIKLQREFPDHPEVLAKTELLELNSPESAEPLLPIESREKKILSQKLKRLNSVLLALEAKNQEIMNPL